MLKRLALCATLLMVSAVAQGQSVFYGVTGTGGAASSLYLINSSNGSTTLIGATGFNGVGSLAFSPGGVLYGIAGNVSSGSGAHQLVSINTSTGAGALIGTTGITGNISDISFRSDGVLFALEARTTRLYTVNTSTGVATLVGGSGSGCGGGCGLAFNASNALYYGAYQNLNTLNPANGAQTAGPGLTGFPGNTNVLSGLAFQAGSGTLYGTAFPGDSGGQSYLVTVNTFTGAMTTVGGNGQFLEAVAILGAGSAPSATPIPSSILLMGIGVLFLASWMVFGRRTTVPL